MVLNVLFQDWTLRLGGDHDIRIPMIILTICYKLLVLPVASDFRSGPKKLINGRLRLDW